MAALFIEDDVNFLIEIVILCSLLTGILILSNQCIGEEDSI